jgi:phosphomannomutase
MMHNTSFDPDIFRAYDIRGIIGKQINKELYFAVAQAISYKLDVLNINKSVVVARDGRLTSQEFSEALIAGFLASGIDVIDLGAVPTPFMYYATNVLNTPNGVMVTGSHNPANYNGIKMVIAQNTLVSDDIAELYDFICQAKVVTGLGKYSKLDIKAAYFAEILGDIKIKRKLRVVVDCGNGIAGPFAPDMLQALGFDVISLYCDVDGSFPNHHPDPTVEANLADLRQAVFAHQADLGLAFDGDGDRLGVVTSSLEIIWPDRLLMLYAQNILARNFDASIVYDVKCSGHLAKFIQDLGGRPVMCPTGHSIVKQELKKHNAALAGEMSGHIFFKDRWYGFDDALYSAVRLLEILTNSDIPVSQQFAQIPASLSTPEIKITIKDSDKFAFMQKFTATCAFPDAILNTLDGLRAEFAFGFGLLRASNTTPCLVARFEADNEDNLMFIKNCFKTQIALVDPELEAVF